MNSSSRCRGEVVLVAVAGDGHAAHQVHDEVRPPGRRRPSIQHAGDFRGHQASACRSASNRAMTCRESIPALMSLTATSRLTGSHCCAIQTVPMPPSPIC